MVNTVLSSVSEVIAYLLQSFRVPYVAPSFLFLILNFYIILPELPKTTFSNEFSLLVPKDQMLLIVGLSFLLGYFLSILNLWIIRLFEGYHWWGTRLGKYLILCKRAERDDLKQIIKDRLEQNSKITENLPLMHPLRIAIANEIEEVRLIEPLVTQKLEERYPKTQEPYLPTSLGNAIAAFEDYPRSRYGIDAVLLWPRFLPILSKNNFSQYVQRSKDQVDFLINICFLLLVFSFEMFLVGLIIAQDWSLWFIYTGILLLVVIVLYKLSLFVVLGWGLTIKVAFDLYRYDLLKSLTCRVPEDFSDERKIWTKISLFINGEDNEKAGESNSDITSKKPLFDYQRISSHETKFNAEIKES
jgi:hypothetical protein